MSDTAAPIRSASLIICTYNRAPSLADTLEAIAKLMIPADLRWELIVVDNNSKDATRATVEAFAARSGLPVRYLFEDKQGLSHARNAGIAAATGDVILFTDDDVLPESDWLVTTLNGMRDFDCVACGGYIAPIWDGEKPSWLTSRFHGYLAVRQDETGPRPITDPNDAPYGANMAFRRDLFDRYGLFDTERGRKGNVLASGEDGEMFQRMLEAGERVYYFPASRVHHKVEAFRLKKAYFRRWRYQTSLNKAKTLDVPGERRLFGIPLYMFGQVKNALVNALIARIKGPEDEAFFRELLVCHFFGTLAGLRAKVREAGK